MSFEMSLYTKLYFRLIVFYTHICFVKEPVLTMDNGWTPPSMLQQDSPVQKSSTCWLTMGLTWNSEMHRARVHLIWQLPKAVWSRPSCSGKVRDAHIFIEPKSLQEWKALLDVTWDPTSSPHVQLVLGARETWRAHLLTLPLWQHKSSLPLTPCLQLSFCFVTVCVYVWGPVWSVQYFPLYFLLRPAYQFH